MHYYLADPAAGYRTGRPHHRGGGLDQSRLIGWLCLAVFLGLILTIWLPYARTLLNATALTILPADWAQSYLAAVAPRTVLAADNKIIINSSTLHIEAPIVEGVESADLLKGVGRDPASVKPGQQGRLILSGHRFWPDPSPWATVFFSLDKLKKDDLITIIYAGQRYRYRVSDQWDVPKDQAHPFLAPTTQPLLTIYTCGPSAYSNRHRIGFNAVLDEQPLQQESPKIINSFNDGVL